MEIGISINGVLRDFFGQIEEVHVKYFPPEEDEDPIKVKDYDLEKWVVFPKEETKQNELSFDPDFVEEVIVDDDEVEVEDIKLDKVDNTVTLEEFMYERCTVEIFGYAEESTYNSVSHLNSLMVGSDDTYKIMSRELGMSIPSTFFFLAKTKSQCQNVIFVKDNVHHWNHVKVMVTDHPDIIKSKPNDCIVIKLLKTFNAEIESDFEITTIGELDNELLEKVSEKLLKIQKT
jgi:hypothetical protein